MVITGKYLSFIKARFNSNFRVQAKEQHLQFSKAPIMSNFGELPFGEIPEPLKFVRPFRKHNSLISYLLL